MAASFHSNIQDPHQNLAPVRTVAMLKDINPLPGTKRKVAVIHWDGQAGIGQHGADMGGGVVGTFKVMGVPGIPFRDETFHKSLEVGAGSWVPVFADHQRSAGMLQEEKAHAFAGSPFAQLSADKMSNIEQSLAAG